MASLKRRDRGSFTATTMDPFGALLPGGLAQDDIKLREADLERRRGYEINYPAPSRAGAMHSTDVINPWRSPRPLFLLTQSSG